MNMSIYVKLAIKHWERNLFHAKQFQISWILLFCQRNLEVYTKYTQPVSLLGKEFCEKLAHPHLFPSGKFGYKAKRKIPISPSWYFNQRLLNYSQKIIARDKAYSFMNIIKGTPAYWKSFCIKYWQWWSN